MPEATEKLFPLFLRLAGRKVIVVGGGEMASTKIAALRAVGADVTVIQREFRAADLDGAWLVVAAATPETNRAVAAAAEERRIFVNVVDDPAAATAYAGGVIRRGGVTVAISTDGRAPALAGLVREGIEALLPTDVARWLETGEALRPAWRNGTVPMAGRRPILLQALNDLYAARPGDKAV